MTHQTGENIMEPLEVYLARKAYNAYGDKANWKTFDGRLMPKWEHLTVAVQENWKAAAMAVHNDEADNFKSFRAELKAKLKELTDSILD
jgi:hypothetical protein